MDTVGDQWIHSLCPRLLAETTSTGAYGCHLSGKDYIQQLENQAINTTATQFACMCARILACRQ